MKGDAAMPKYSVKKPFTILVAVILVLVLGFVSLTGIQTDLLPAMNLPYLLVMTTYPGASPEQVEADVTSRWKTHSRCSTASRMSRARATRITA